jgi:hypothetical protein
MTAQILNGQRAKRINWKPESGNGKVANVNISHHQIKK